MRILVGLAMCTLAAVLVQPATRAQEPNSRELLEAFEKHGKLIAQKTSSSIACIVVSRSEHYPKAAGGSDVPGKLGDYDPKAFLKSAITPERVRLSHVLDLSDIQGIPDHGCVGGVVIDASGLVLTTYQSIEGAKKIYVFLPGGGSYADIHAADSRSDLAVLKLITPPTNLEPIKFADVRTRDDGERRQTMYAGKLVWLLTNSYGSGLKLNSPSIDFGTISSIRHRLLDPNPSTDQTPSMIESYYKFGVVLEHNVRLNAGITGGTLVDINGDMVGLTTANAVVYNRELGPGYALPMDEHVRRIIEVLRRGEEVEYGFLGVYLSAMNGPFRISQPPTAGSPAALANLQQLDVISHIDGHPVSGNADLLLHVGCALAGNKVKLTIIRDGRTRDVEVTLAKFQNQQPFVASVRPEPVFGLRVDYGSIATIRLKPPGGVPPGVAIREIVPDSPAAAKFKGLGETADWLITRVDGVGVANPAELYKAARGKPSVKLTLQAIMDPARTREITLP
jgi:serine protease Do